MEKWICRVTVVGTSFDETWMISSNCDGFTETIEEVSQDHKETFINAMLDDKVIAKFNKRLPLIIEYSYDESNI